MKGRRLGKGFLEGDAKGGIYYRYRRLRRLSRCRGTRGGVRLEWLEGYV